jgi:serine/threonine protein kinase
VAIKLIERGPEKITKFVDRELINHSKMLHPHVIQFREVFLTEQYLGVAMEYAAGGDMFQYVTRHRGLSEQAARSGPSTCSTACVFRPLQCWGAWPAAPANHKASHWHSL